MSSNVEKLKNLKKLQKSEKSPYSKKSEILKIYFFEEKKMLSS